MQPCIPRRFIANVFLYSVGDYPFKGLYKYTHPAFGCYDITDLRGPTYPHVKAIMYNGIVATDSTILRGELLPAICIMLTQFWKMRFVRQKVSPVITDRKSVV